MIGFYRRGFRRTAHAIRWMRQWSKRHPWKARVIAFVLVDLVIVVTGNTYAYADSGNGVVAPFLPGGSIHDSAGVPLSSYISLPIDRGDIFSSTKTFLAWWVDLIWAGHLGFVAWVIWLVNMLLSYQWVSWIATPFNGFATLLQGWLGQLDWIPVALAISGLVGGISLMLGRWARGVGEWFVAATIAALTVGVLANPVASLTGSGGALDNARDFGSQLAAAVVTDKGSPTVINSDDALSEAVTSQLVDIFVRIPAQTIAFGHTLTGDCNKVFTDTMTSSAPALSGDNTVRDSVGGCDAAAQSYVTNPNFGEILTTGIVAVGGLVLLGLAVSLGVFFLYTVVLFLIAALKTMGMAYIAILPVNRTGFWRALADTAFGLISLVSMTVVLAAYLKVIVYILTVTGSLGIVPQMGTMELLVVVGMVLLWRVRRAHKRAGRRVADRLGKLGMGGNAAPPRDRMAAIATMSSVASAARQFMPRGRGPAPQQQLPPYTDNRSVNFHMGAGGGAGPIDGGTLVASSATPPPSGAAPVPHGPSVGPAPRRDALVVPTNAGKAQLVLRATKTAGTAVRLARGAAAGGVPGLATAAALEVGNAAAGWAASRAIAAAPPRGPRQIVVGSDGIGRVEHREFGPVGPPPRPRSLPASPRSTQMRELLSSTPPR